MSTAALALIRFSKFLNRIALWGAVVAVAIMVGTSMFQVLARYIFFSPPIWTEELARYAMVWAGMLGASCAFHTHADPTLFPDARSVIGHKGLTYAAIRTLGVAIFAIPVLWYSFIGPNGGFQRGFIVRSLERNAEMLDIPMIWIASAIPLAFIIILIHSAAELAARSIGAPTGSESKKIKKFD